MKFLKSFFIAASIILFFSVPKNAFAHVLETDGSIGAVLHMDPDDNPIAKTYTGFYLDFKDKNGKFGVDICSCQFEILEKGKIIYNASFTEADKKSVGSFFYMFPKKGVYELKVGGRPVLPNTFDPFELTYTIRVEREKESTKSIAGSNDLLEFLGSHVYHTFTGIVIIAISLVFLVLKLTRKIKKK